MKAAAALPLLLAREASACAVCMGGDSAATDGFRWGIILLLAVTFTMVAGVAWALWRVEKARAAAEGA